MPGWKVTSTHPSGTWQLPEGRSIFEIVLAPLLPELAAMHWYCAYAENGPFSNVDAEEAGFTDAEIEGVFLLTAENSPDQVLAPDLVTKFARFISPAYKLLACLAADPGEIIPQVQRLIDLRLDALFKGVGSLQDSRRERDRFISLSAEVVFASYDSMWVGIYTPRENWLRRFGKHVATVGGIVGGVRVEAGGFDDEDRTQSF